MEQQNPIVSKEKVKFNLKLSGVKIMKILSVVSFVIALLLLLNSFDGFYEYFDAYYGKEYDLYVGIISLLLSINSSIVGAMLLGFSTMVKTSVIQQAIYHRKYILEEEVVTNENLTKNNTTNWGY